MLRVTVHSPNRNGRSDSVFCESAILRPRGFFGTRLPRLSQTALASSRRRCSVAIPIRNSSLSTAALGHSKIFGAPLEKTQFHTVLSGRPFALIVAASVAVVVTFASLGLGVGARLPGNAQRIGKWICAAVGMLLGGFLSKVVWEVHEDAAGVDVHNAIITQDPATIDPSLIQQLSKRYGLNLARKLNPQLCQFYDRYLESCIPKGEASLTGKEASKLIAFKNALGITDEEAASVHMDVGRRLSRSTFEMEKQSDRKKGLAFLKAFQAWIYLSYLVFGERKAAFLLPLRRVFNLSQSQITVAIRENGKAVFQQKIDELGENGLLIERSYLEKLRQAQLASQLSDEVASEVILDVARKKIEVDLREALASIRDRSKTKDLGLPVHKMSEVLEFNQALGAFAEERSETLPPGLQKVTIQGGAFDRASSYADQRELFQLFLEEKLVSLEGQFTIKLSNELDQLRIVLDLGSKEAERVTREVCSKVYRRLLREEYTSGRLEAAESKATVLQRLCDRLQFRPELAAAMHKNIYLQKLQTALEENGKITDEDENELRRIQTLMCIPDNDVMDVMRATVGKRFATVIDDALGVGYEAFSESERVLVSSAMQRLRISPELGKDVLDSTARKIFLQYITASRMKQDRLESARELKKLVFFSNIVIAPLLEDIKTAQVDLSETMRRFSEALTKASEDVKPAEDTSTEPTGTTPSTLSKATKAKVEFESGKDTIAKTGDKMASQKEITLRTDLELRDRTEIYRNYLLYCMSGEVISMPLGGQIVLERDMAEFGRLSQLGDILGLTQLDVVQVHTELAEQAFRLQVKQLLDEGPLTKEKTDALNDMQNKMGLSPEQGQKIIKGVQNERMSSTLQSAKAMGDVTVEKLLDMKDTGVEIEAFTSVEFRKRLYEQEIERLLSDGKGEFNQEYIYTRLPTSLVIDPVKARESVEELAKGKRKLQVVQAMSDLRMQQFDALVADVNNLIVTSKVLATSKMQNGQELWNRRDEVLDLYSVYYWKTKDLDKAADLAQIFKIEDTEAQSLKAAIDDGTFSLVEEAKDEGVFF